MPGEIAPAHRHSPCALRFIVEGTGAYTAINGEKSYMEVGDLILTPSWVWHDHGHDGDVPVVWLDGLDIPLVRQLGPVFAEAWTGNTTVPDGPAEGDSNARYGANMLPMDRAAPSVTSPIFRYPYSETKAALAQLAAGGNIDACHGVKMEYINPDNAGPVLPTLSAFMQQLPAGFRGENYQSTAAWVYHAVEGQGRTIVGDKILEWGPKDIFVVPAWYPHRHEAESASFLYSFSDKGVHEKLGLFRDRRGADAEG